MLQLGRSEGGSKYLAQMQCGSLFSDVQAFKVDSLENLLLSHFYGPFYDTAQLLNEQIYRSFYLSL